SERLNTSSGQLATTAEIYGEQELAAVNLSQLPILFHYAGDGGYYLTAAVWIVRDPEWGTNLSYHRMMILDAKRGSVRVVENRGLHQALLHSQGRAEVAICLGAAPAVLLAASFSPPANVDELELAARLMPIRLAKCKTVDLMVPADCEIVLEGHFTGESASEGPFVDITGTWDFVRQQPVVEITRIAYRTDPIYHALVPGQSEHKTLMGMPKELDIFKAVNEICCCQDVRLTPGGCSWLHAIIQIKKHNGDDGKKAITAAFEAHRSLKHCIVVDDDIDIQNSQEVEWALATRFQATTDLLILENQPSSSLDPSAVHAEGQKSRGAKMGIDATIKKTGHERQLFTRVTF
ncbi:MAG: UbiD family decarboxylase, partial [candidate division KSB1 bacterium]|nr:UbiD family decarboxylase [candidate division KSB1 bacterium]